MESHREQCAIQYMNMYDASKDYSPNIEQNELDTNYSYLMKYSAWIVSHTII